MQDSETHRGKIELTIGDLHFAGEGDQDWLDQQIDKLIDTVSRRQINDPVDEDSSSSESKSQEAVTTGSLVSYLRAKGDETVQVQRFLSTAAWLYHRGRKDLTTSSVTKALRDNQQKRLGNPSDCLNKNVTRGFCEKTTGGFFITPDGWRQLDENPPE